MFNSVLNTTFPLMFNDFRKVSLVLIGYKRNDHNNVEAVLGLLFCRYDKTPL